MRGVASDAAISPQSPSRLFGGQIPSYCTPNKLSRINKEASLEMKSFVFSETHPLALVLQ